MERSLSWQRQDHHCGHCFGGCHLDVANGCRLVRLVSKDCRHLVDGNGIQERDSHSELDHST